MNAISEDGRLLDIAKYQTVLLIISKQLNSIYLQMIL